MKPHYNEVLGTIKITLLYQVSHYIRVRKTKKYKDLGPANYLVYNRVLSDLFITRFHCNNNTKVNLCSTITMQIYSTALLEKGSMLGQCQIILDQFMYYDIIDTYVWGKACTNRWVFNSVLNEIIDWDFLIERGRCHTTVESCYNEVLGTMKITLLYLVSHYIRVKKYEELEPVK